MSADPVPVDGGQPELVDERQPDRAGAGAEPLVERFQQRVTIDLDGKHHGSFEAFRLRATRIWHNLDDVADRVDVHVSTGQKGLHFVGWFVDDVPFHEQVAIRRGHGDDPRRIDMDCQRWLELGGRFSDVLFQQKGDRAETKERRFRDVYDALDYIAARRDDYQRVKSVQLDGHRGDPELARRADL